jgi:hypothetical protein
MREVYDFYFDGGREARFSGESYAAALKEFKNHFPYEIEQVEKVQEEDNDDSRD